MATRTALLLIDLINVWQMPDGDALRRRTRRQVPAIASLIARARRNGWRVMYVNDSFGRWRSDFSAVIACAEKSSDDAASIARELAPGPADELILKPRHSAFFQTPLEMLLEKHGIRRLVLVGVAGDQCLLATASDALLREYTVNIPRDLVICANASRTRAIVRHFRDVMDIDVRDSTASFARSG